MAKLKFEISLLLLFFIGFMHVANSENGTLNRLANAYLKEYKVPGIAISVIKSDQIYYGVAGVKKHGESEKIALDSKFQIASNSKAITATIAALMVQQGKIAWDSKLLEIVPDLKGKIRNAYLNITLEELLSNRAKVQPFEEDDSQEWKGMPSSFSTENSKYEFAEYALNLEPKTNLDKNHSYSNGGFIIAALMLEKSSGKSWAELVEQFNQTFEVDTFLGFPNQEDVSGTFGHKKKFGKYRAVKPKDEQNFQFDFSPAGNLSISIADLTSIIRNHLEGLMGQDNVLKSTTYKKLHYGFKDYSLGWYNGHIGDTSQKFSYHGGSLGTFSSAIMLSADRETAIIILINSDDKKTTELKNNLREELWKKYGTQH